MNNHPTAPDARLPRPLAPRTLLGLQIAAVVILVGWALHATASVSALIAAAIFAAIAMTPLHRWVTARTGRRWVGHVVTFLVMVVVLLAFAGGLFFAAQRVAAEFPSLSQVSEMIPGASAESTGAGPADSGVAAAVRSDGEANGNGGGTLGGPLSEAGAAAGQIASRLAGFAAGAALTGLQFVTTAVSGLVLVLFLALIMLIDAPRWRARATRVFGDDSAGQIEDAMAVLSRHLMHYVLVRGGIGLLSATLYMLWLWPFDVNLVLVWGVLTFLLSFIPSLGSIISGILPTIYAFLTKDFGTAVAVGAGLTVIEQVIGNYVDPRVQGRQVSISPAVIYTALLLFAWIWGVPGALLSTPVLIAAVIAFSRIDPLRPVALLLSNTSSYDELDEAVRH